MVGSKLVVQLVEMLVEPLPKLLDTFSVDTTAASVGLYPFPRDLQVLPLVYLVDQ